MKMPLLTPIESIMKHVRQLVVFLLKLYANAVAAANSPNPVVPLAVCLPWAALLALQITVTAAEDNLSSFRPPAVPLVACDPYFSIWSPADKLTDGDTVHWTGKPHRLTSLINIDGKPFRLIGKEPHDVPPFPQVNLAVSPTRSIYTFEGEGLRLTLTFMTPALPDDL